MPLLKRPSPPSPKDAKNGNSQTFIGQGPQNSQLQALQQSQSPDNPAPSAPTLENLAPTLESSNSPEADEILSHLPSPEGDSERVSEPEDDNMNLTSTTIKGKGVMKSALNPKFSFSHIRNATVFSLFGNFARYIGMKKGVHFPKEVVQDAEDKGETSPDGHKVPLMNYPYKATYSQKKSNVVRVVRGAEFKPRLAWISDSNKCEVGCERCLTSCNCLGSYQDPKSVLKEKAKKKKHKKAHDSGDGPPKLTKLTESFMNHVNVAEVFLIAHKTKTLNSALEYVDGATLQIASSSPSKDSGKSHASAEKSTSGTEFGFEDELPPLSSSRLGRLATNIWIFGLCIPQLFTSDDPPSESSYRILMGSLAALAVSASDGGRDVLMQSKEFHNYAQEAMRVIKNLQLRIFLQGETDVKRPLRMGKGLQLGKKGQRPPFEILVAKINNPNDPLEFKPFNEWGRVHKSNALNNLAGSTFTEFESAKHQIDFLVDDIKETTYDTKNESDLLYRLSEMYHCIVYISERSQSNPTEKSIAELRMICETMSKFVLSLHSFICASEHVMEKIMEVRDIIHLTYVYLLENVSIDLSKLMPTDALDTMPYIMEFPNHKDRKKHSCCAVGHKKKQGHIPKYSGSDFHRVFYEDAFDAKDCVVEGYVFRIRPSNLSKEEEKQRKLQRRAKPAFKFRNIGKGPTPKYSIASINISPDDMEEAPLKPILKDTGLTPVTSSTAVIATDVNVRYIGDRMDADDEPIIERRGMDSVILTRKMDDKKHDSKKNPSL